MSEITPAAAIILKALNQLYEVGPYRKTATPPSAAESIIQRFADLAPQKRLLLVKSLRGSPDIPQRSFGGSLKIKEAASVPTIVGVCSSSAPDLTGDIMAESALADLRDGLLNSIFFGNHSYRIPEDAYGMIVDTTLTKGAVSKLGITVRVARENPRAMQSYEMIRNGLKAGISIGCIVLESHPIDLGKGRKGMSIDRCLGLEASLVGLPSNRDSWATAKSQRRP